MQRILDGLDPESRENLEGHLGNPDVSAVAIRDALIGEGFLIGKTAIWEYRRATLTQVRTGGATMALFENRLAPPVRKEAKVDRTKPARQAFNIANDPLDPKSFVDTFSSVEQRDDEATYREAIVGLGGQVPAGYRARMVKARLNGAAWTRELDATDAAARPTWSYDYAIEPTPTPAADVSDVIERIVKAMPGKTKRLSATGVYHFQAGDLQLGKSDGDGDGSQGLVAAYKRGVEVMLAELPHLAGNHFSRPAGSAAD